ncbi:dephospho-CoA kinase [Aeoliella mucimassa]|uniref:Dephospho-CoA kinase n=1 Tax=Aeoliella mucimassa TaxID=2527972 RepID=A0A518ANV4_9BACT|nr:dephospho-CoA kinase [Aeoliella mucimassa]QDU56404.1 Dephospho-CoA kinase [Aeoliella mucimassa]
MLTIGLIGGIASGKSTVAEMLADCGAVVLNADKVAHEVLNSPEVRTLLVNRWGPGILYPDESINRSAIARQVFGKSTQAVEERKYLESVVHPRTRLLLEEHRDQLAIQGHNVFIIDAPLLLEAGWDTECDMVLMVKASDERRIENAARRGWSVDELNRREDAQLPLATKRHRADVAIENSGTLAETREQVAIFWNEVVVPQLGD